ncbi:MAG: ParB/RepB/Spo0J family partition protein [Candidatus Hydrogenedentes bacterium]|nr:ParB/RepB/Spo0J family partition protein [Candidatus Hydrogenedentota bacterium]
MNDVNKKRKQGKGLNALLRKNLPKTTGSRSASAATTEPANDHDRILMLDPTTLTSNPHQPRRIFDEEPLQELAASIRRDGVQEPIIVRRVKDNYEIVCGERRCRATIMADLDTIPAVCREVADQDMLKFGLIENIQREDLNAIELAIAYRQLMKEYKWTQERLSEEVGKKRATIANTVRLLQLPEVIQEQVADGTLSMGHARAILAVEGVDAQLALARKIIDKGASVRQAEQMAATKTTSKSPKKESISAKPSHIIALEDRLRKRLGAKVAVKEKGAGQGRIEIEYFSLDDLERLLALIIKK